MSDGLDQRIVIPVTVSIGKDIIRPWARTGFKELPWWRIRVETYLLVGDPEHVAVEPLFLSRCTEEVINPGQGQSQEPYLEPIEEIRPCQVDMKVPKNVGRGGA